MIRQAWDITWRCRFLWLLGVLAGGAVGVPSLGGGGGDNTGWRLCPGDLEHLNSSVPSAEQVSAWISANLGLLIALAVVCAALLLLLIVLSFIAQGGMAQATADLASGRPSSLNRAWSAGLRQFCRHLRLWLMDR
jgi:hypothetical protein